MPGLAARRRSLCDVLAQRRARATHRRPRSTPPSERPALRVARYPAGRAASSAGRASRPRRTRPRCRLRPSSRGRDTSPPASYAARTTNAVRSTAYANQPRSQATPILFGAARGRIAAQPQELRSEAEPRVGQIGVTPQRQRARRQERFALAAPLGVRDQRDTAGAHDGQAPAARAAADHRLRFSIAWTHRDAGAGRARAPRPCSRSRPVRGSRARRTHDAPAGRFDLRRLVVDRVRLGEALRSRPQPVPAVRAPRAVRRLALCVRRVGEDVRPAGEAVVRHARPEGDGDAHLDDAVGEPDVLRRRRCGHAPTTPARPARWGFVRRRAPRSRRRPACARGARAGRRT